MFLQQIVLFLKAFDGLRLGRESGDQRFHQGVDAALVPKWLMGINPAPTAVDNSVQSSGKIARVVVFLIRPAHEA